MTTASATRALLPLALLALLTACERPKGPPPPKAEAVNAAGQAAPSTVALSGTILDPQPSPATARPSMPSAGSAASAGAAGDGPAQVGGDNQALKDFQTEQERRDRELLDQDLSEAQLRDGEPYALPREDGDWSPSDQLAPDELPLDEFPPDDGALMDEPPFEEPPYDDELPLDDGYAPREGGYRP